MIHIPSFDNKKNLLNLLLNLNYLIGNTVKINTNFYQNKKSCYRGYQ